MGGYAVSLAVGSVTQVATERGAAIALAVIAVLLAAGLAVAARASWRARRAARAPVVVWQILQAALAYDALQARSEWGVLLLVLAVVAAVGACWPGVLRDGRIPGEPAG